MDAWGAQNASFGNLWKATAEINESIFPHIQWGRDYRTDSGGAGQWRGLCGSHWVKEVRVPAKVYTYVVGMKYPMPGICGGEPGAPNKLTLKVGSDEPVVVKNYPNSFVQTDLDEVLKTANASNLVLAGFMTHMCVNSTARGAFNLGYAPTVVAAATATRALPGLGDATVPAEAMQVASLAAMADLFAVVVPGASDIPD